MKQTLCAAHADAGQMHLYLNNAREHWTNEGENPPIGLILCAQKDDAVARYALEGLAMVPRCQASLGAGSNRSAD